MTDSSMEKRKKGTLTLKKDRSPVSRNEGGKLPKNTKGTVVVITKTKRVGSEGVLTSSEKERRLEALKNSYSKEQEKEKQAVSFSPMQESFSLDDASDGIKNLDNGHKKTTEIPSVKQPKISKKVEIKKDTKEGKEQERNFSQDEEEAKQKKKSKVEVKKISKRVVIQNLDELRDDVETSITTIKQSVHKSKKNNDKSNKEKQKVVKKVIIKGSITVQELSNQLAEKVSHSIKTLMKLGVMASNSHVLDSETAELLANELGHELVISKDEEVLADLLKEESNDEKNVALRAPIVTIMGHVDHGKTSLLDALRTTDVASGEHGGITQHIGAYTVTLNNHKAITFIDTPGHEAFTEMRVRGANVTDIVILVVAADDGIKEQTVEAIQHAKAANVPIIIAVNKIDKPGANLERVKNSLYQHSLIPDDMGGDIMVIPVSAKEKKGLDALEESILLQAEMLELKADFKKRGSGVVLESKLDKNRGVIATLLVQNGLLKTGDIVFIKDQYFKVRSLIDDKGKSTKLALPSVPVEVLGLSQSPASGEQFLVLENEKVAKKALELHKYITAKNTVSSDGKASLESLFKQSDDKVFNLIIKADVHGSVEAIKSALLKLPSETVSIKVLHAVVGGIVESDVSLAKASNAIIFGFNVRADSKAKSLSQSLSVDIRYHSIIYDLLDDVENIIHGLISPEKKEKYLGVAEIRQVFNLKKQGKIAGCMILDGIINNKARVKILRDNIVLHDDKISALKRFKDDIKEVRSGFECGISLERFNDIKEGDKLEAYIIE